ncbi:MAG: response regulator [Planctomycetota bacterium]|nr:MAG: response regulator [Planctomycetota bacterium]
MKALVVDDSMTIRRIVIKALGIVGITDTAQASNGAEALEAVKQQQFDVILLDWNMPKLSGIEALRALRQSGNKTPVIMVTTEAEKARVIEAIKTGANDYLIKPFSPDQLAEKVKGLTAAAAG